MHIVIPVKAVELAKSRLRPVLGASQRAQLARTMLCGVLRAAGEVFGVDGIVIVSRAPLTGLDDMPMPIEWLPEHPGAGSMNAALMQAAHALHRRGGQRMLVLPGDLPCLHTADVQHLVDAVTRAALLDENAVVVAPDTYCRGTNALSVSLPIPFELRYGSNSFAAHIAAARQAGCTISVVHNLATASDLDDPNGLHRLRGLPPHAFSTPALHALLEGWWPLALDPLAEAVRLPDDARLSHNAWQPGVSTRNRPDLRV